MSSSVRYRFKNAVSEDTVSFDGAVIQIGDVKRLIALKRGLGAEGAAELTLFDPSTNEEYADDSKVIPRNSLVLVKRTPATKFKPLQSAAGGATAQLAAPAAPQQQQRLQQGTAAAAGAHAANGSGAAAGQQQQQQQQHDEFGGDYYSEQPTAAVVREDEDKALQSLLQGTASTWQREVRQGAMRGRGRGRGGGIPFDYRCPRWVGAGPGWWWWVLGDFCTDAGIKPKHSWSAAGSKASGTAFCMPDSSNHSRQSYARALPVLPCSPAGDCQSTAAPPRPALLPTLPQVRGGGAALGAGLPHSGRPQL